MRADMTDLDLKLNLTSAFKSLLLVPFPGAKKESTTKVRRF